MSTATLSTKRRYIETTWHQQRAGHISAAVTSGFTSREEAEAFAARLRSHHPEMPVFVCGRKEEE